MQKLSMMYVVVKCIALATSIVAMLEAGDKIELIVLLSLAFSCVIAVQYIFSFQEKYRVSVVFLNGFAVIFCIVFGPKSLLPLLILFLAEIIDLYIQDTHYYTIVACIAFMLYLIFAPSYLGIAFGITILVCTFYIRYLTIRTEEYRETMLFQKEELCLLEEKIKDNNRFIKTLRYSSALEERNRLAAKLHDKIGHGISGSIIMLEASMMMLDKDSKRARNGIETSIANLRAGVDEIRFALKEERPIKSELGLNEIKIKLEQFKSNYGIVTTLLEQGNLSFVGLSLWHCIHDNLEEALTNLLKHSNANAFSLKLVSNNKILSVEYRDNGTNYKVGEKTMMGLGLEAMEERTIKSGGKFFIEQTSMGFVIKNIFICE